MVYPAIRTKTKPPLAGACGSDNSRRLAVCDGPWFDRLRWRDYLGAMKIKTSIAVDKALLEKAAKLSNRYRNRSELMEAVLRTYVARVNRQEKRARDLAIINRRAADLNQEARDVLDYQVAL